VTDNIWGGRGLAGGNIDGLPGNEIVACTSSQKARAYTATGAELWVSEAVGCDMPALTDLDGDGAVEVLLEGAVLDGKTGLTELTFDAAGTSWWHKKALAADGDADGQLEIVTASRILEADGTVVVDTGLGGTFPAVADFDLDGKPEVAVVDNLHGTGTHWLHLWRHNPAMPGMFEVLRQNLDLNNGVLVTAYCGAMFEYGGGPPTVADFDGDGVPDVGVAGAVGYIVFSGKKLMDPNVAPADTVLWFTQTQDCSSAFTGSSVFDFDGNGKAEVVYADELYMRIYDGTTGDVLLQVCNTSGTLHEYPLVADVDNDSHGRHRRHQQQLLEPDLSHGADEDPGPARVRRRHQPVGPHPPRLEPARLSRDERRRTARSPRSRRPTGPRPASTTSGRTSSPRVSSPRPTWSSPAAPNVSSRASRPSPGSATSASRRCPPASPSASTRATPTRAAPSSAPASPANRSIPPRARTSCSSCPRSPRASSMARNPWS
jgi:hypothetical protein